MLNNVNENTILDRRAYRPSHSSEVESEIVGKCNELIKVVASWKMSSWKVRMILSRIDEELDRSAVVEGHEFTLRW